VAPLKVWRREHPALEAIDPRTRTPIERELVRSVMGGLVMMPLYWETLPVLKVKGVKDHKGKTGNNTWFFFNWDRD